MIKKHTSLLKTLLWMGSLLFLLSLVTCKEVDEILPEITKPDTGKIAGIVYPPLTARDGLGLQLPVPPDEHPRLFFRRQDIPGLKAKVSDPLMQDCWNRIIQSAARSTSGALPQDGTIHNLDVNIRNSIEAKALISVFSGDAATGRTAIDAMLNFFGTLKIDPDKQDVTRDFGRVILTGAMVYDWCYDILTEREKEILIFRMENLAKQMEIKWPQLVQGSFVGHGSENQLAREMLACGIATYDEKPEIYKLAAGRIMAEFLPARRYFYPAGYYHQGSSYGPTRFACDMWTTFLFDRMGHPQFYGSDQGLVPYFWIYMRRPDGQYFRDGDDFLEKNAFGKYWPNVSDILSGSYFQDPIILGDAVKQGGIGQSYDFLLDYLIFNTDVAVNQDKSSLPLTRYFKEPAGIMVARTGWEEGINSNTVVAMMKVGVYNFSNHQHLDAGNFQLYYKAPLAIESGIYEGALGGYGSDHFKHYYQRTIAHNSMLIYDPAEKFLRHSGEISNDGGQQYPNNAREPQNLSYFLDNNYKTGEVLAHYFGPDPVQPEISYLKGELSPAYKKEKVTDFTRSFVFINTGNADIPAIFIVYDHVTSSDKNYKKYWLLHCVEEPDIAGNHTVIKRSEKGYNGKLINTTLLPETTNLTINKIGGPGNEYEVFGKTYPQYYTSTTNSFDGAEWRIEVSPKEAALTDNFLNVMQVMDYSGGPGTILHPELLETERLTGVKIEHRMILFSKSGEIIGDTINLTIPGEGSYKIFIADVMKGSWKIEHTNGSEYSSQIISGENQLLYFDTEKGDLVITRQSL